MYGQIQKLQLIKKQVKYSVSLVIKEMLSMVLENGHSFLKFNWRKNSSKLVIYFSSSDIRKWTFLHMDTTVIILFLEMNLASYLKALIYF